MKRIGRVFWILGKWSLILGAIYIGTTLFNDMNFESRTGWFLSALAMAIAYVDGTQKERIANLEFRVQELARRIDGYG
jgi:hypothetical protein